MAPPRTAAHPAAVPDPAEPCDAVVDVDAGARAIADAVGLSPPVL